MSSSKLFIFPILERIYPEPTLGQNPQKFCSRFIFSTDQQPLGVATWPIMCPLKCGILCSSHFPISPIRIFINVFNKHLLNTCYVAGPTSTGLDDSWSRPQEKISLVRRWASEYPQQNPRMIRQRLQAQDCSSMSKFCSKFCADSKWSLPYDVLAHSFHGMFWSLICCSAIC